MYKNVTPGDVIAVKGSPAVLLSFLGERLFFSVILGRAIARTENLKQQTPPYNNIIFKKEKTVSPFAGWDGFI
jgi:hypothetical protein